VKQLAGKTAIVTGGTQGVGAGITRRLLEAGANVVICARNQPAHQFDGDAQPLFIQADVRESEDIDRVVNAANEAFGSVDVLINNAGGSPFVPADEASPRFNRKIIELNLIAPMTFSQRANAVMQMQDTGGAIINIASVSGARPSPGTSAYGAAKAGLIHLTTSLAIEWAPKVRVNAITAGMIRTEKSHLHYGDEAGIARVAATVPLGRMGTPEDIGNACVFLASSQAAYITGASLEIHGGGEEPAFLRAARGE
jgi:NAD(P)-dependent dehydrogenase (short-subunit alcohol dehydrogenase family)